MAGSADRSYPTSLFENYPSAKKPCWLPPVDQQEVWAAGVTYERSRSARQEEAVDGGDIYARVYRLSVPSCFLRPSDPV